MRENEGKTRGKRGENEGKGGERRGKEGEGGEIRENERKQ